MPQGAGIMGRGVTDSWVSFGVEYGNTGNAEELCVSMKHRLLAERIWVRHHKIPVGEVLRMKGMQLREFVG